MSGELPPRLKEGLLRLHQAGAPSSIYPFVFLGVEAVKIGDQTGEDVADAFATIESFLVRRAVCGIEPTGLHAVFKGMWNEIVSNNEYDGRVNSKAVEAIIRRRTTVTWPKDEMFRDALVRDALYKRKICKFVVAQLEIFSNGETPENDFWIEHILPNKFHAENWGGDFSPEEHANLKDTVGNLLPLTAEMNLKASQNPFDNKRREFEGSIFSTTRTFAKHTVEWTPASIVTRSNEIANWAIRRWPHSSQLFENKSDDS